MEIEIIVLAALVMLVMFYYKKQIEKFLKLTKQQSNMLFIFLLLCLCSGGVVSITSRTDATESNVSVVNNSEATTTNQAQKTEHEVWVDAGEIAVDEIKKIDAKNQEKNANYEANRPQRWVYQIGDYTKDEESISELYKKIKHIGKISLFRDGKKYFLFKNEVASQDQLNASLEEFRVQISNIIKIDKIEPIDLMRFTDRKENKIVYESKRLGKRRDNLNIDCYYVSK